MSLLLSGNPIFLRFSVYRLALQYKGAGRLWRAILPCQTHWRLWLAILHCQTRWSLASVFTSRSRSIGIKYKYNSQLYNYLCDYCCCWMRNNNISMYIVMYSLGIGYLFGWKFVYQAHLKKMNTQDKYILYRHYGK